MSNIFFNNDIEKEFLFSDFEYYKKILDFKEEEKILFQNLQPNFKDFYDFLSSENNFFVIQGFLGCGKTTFVKKAIKLCQNNSLTFSFVCNKATHLDDLLFDINQMFKEYSLKRLLALPQLKTKDFRERINAYIKINYPIILFIDEFENIQDSNYNEDFINFLQQLTRNNNLKIIIAARYFNDELFKDIKIQKSIIKAFDKTNFNSLLDNNKLSIYEKSCEDFFEISKGYYFYLSTTLNLCKMLNISYKDLISEYQKKEKSYCKFLINKLLSLLPDNYQNLLTALSFSKLPITEEILLENKFIKKSELNYLQEINLLSKTQNGYYLKDYIKNEILKENNSYENSKIHKFLRNLFLEQLPLKPNERILKYSRATLRVESEYHNEQYEKYFKSHKSKKENSFQPDVTYLSYSHIQNNDLNPQKTIQKAIKDTQENKEANSYISTINNTEEENINLSNEELELINSEDKEEKYSQNLSKDAEKITNNSTDIIFTNTTKIEKKLSEKEISDLAKLAEEECNYNDAINYYSQLASSQTEIQKYLTLTKLAIIYQKQQNYTKSLELFNEICSFYKTNNELLKAAYILFNISQIYKEMYKFEKEKEILEEILNLNCQKPYNFKAKILLEYGSIENFSQNYNKSKLLYKEALENALLAQDNLLQTEAYFKYALIFDENTDLENAKKYYLLSISSLDNYQENEFLAAAYSNLAAIFKEEQNKDKALKYFQKALFIDEKLANFEGQYLNYNNLAELCLKDNPKNAINYYMKSLFAAKQLKDNFYITCALLAIGDFYYRVSNNEMALKFYISSKKYIKQDYSKENQEKLTSRIEDIKIRMGKTKFYNYIKELKNNAKKR